MSESSNRGLLIAILVVAVLNLVVGAVQSALLLRRDTPTAVASSTESLPARYTEATLAQIAKRITEPYNQDDLDGLYSAFDDFAKNQLSADKFKSQISGLRKLVGNVSSASYAGFRVQPTDNSLKMYTLTYVVKLTGGATPSGNMLITVIDRPSGPGIVGFFINGRTQQ